MLAAAGQINLNIEQCAKQGHHKQSVQLYFRDDVWPSLFLQRDILIEIGSGWRPLTSQARGAKQPLPEPSFSSPPITEEDLQCLQMATRSKNPTIKSSIHIETKPPSNGPSNPTDDNSSASSESDSFFLGRRPSCTSGTHIHPSSQQEVSHCPCCFADQLRFDDSISFQNQRQIFRS